jgi:hypothetical protein
VSDYGALQHKIVSSAISRLDVAVSAEGSFGETNDWLRELSVANSERRSAMLLAGALSASVEVVSTVYLGLVRQAIYSLRTYYELSLGWLYYKDHPIEWDNVVFTSDQALLPGDVKRYLKNYIPRYESRWQCLNENRTRKQEDPYSIMSSFVHGNLLSTLPTATNPSAIVFDQQVVEQVPAFISCVSEYISDSYVSSQLSNWESIPLNVRAKVDNRLKGNARIKLDFT